MSALWPATQMRREYKSRPNRVLTEGIMKLLGYGEDALTLWVLRHRLDKLLDSIDDKSDPEGCVAYFRPSFGRSGGPNSSQFGEFDSSF